MKTICIHTKKSAAIHFWMSGEFASWDDSGRSADHVCAILQRFGGKLEITEQQAKELIDSGNYYASYRDDEVDYDSPKNGARIKSTISRYVNKLKGLL